MRTGKQAVKRGLRDLLQLTTRSRTRIDDALTRARTHNYRGQDLVNDIFEQVQDGIETLTGILMADDAIPTAYIRYRADNTAAAQQSSELSLPTPLTQAQMTALQKSDLLGPVVGGAQKSILAANITLRIQPAAAAQSTDYIVEVNQAVAPADAGLYRGILVDGGRMLAEIQVLTYV